MTPRARAFCSSGLRNFLNRVSTQQLLKGLATVPGHHTESCPLERVATTRDVENLLAFTALVRFAARC